MPFTPFGPGGAPANVGGAPTQWVNVVTQFDADPTGGTDSTAAIQAALLSFGTLGGAGGGQGGTCYFPPGVYLTSKPLIRPSNVTMEGDGATATTIQLATGSNCAVVQAATYQSAEQAAVLGVSADDIANAFYGGIKQMQLHGDAFHTVVAGYNAALEHTTNPLTDSAPNDPDFDPRPIYENLTLTGATGDGYIHNGRSAAKLSGILSQYHNGLCFVPSFDTTLEDCLGNNCGGGFYLNHFSDVADGSKSYNHGQGNTKVWVSGTGDYTPGNTVIFDGAMYFCIEAVSGSATTPDADPAHWTELTGATAPQAWGTGVYADSGAGEFALQIDCQENSANNYVFAGCAPGTVTGTSANPNFPNDGTNPNNYCHVIFDDCNGVVATLAATGSNGAAYIYGSGAGTAQTSLLLVGTDNSETALKAPGATPQTVFYNGAPSFPAGLVTSFFFLYGNQLMYNELLSQLAGGGTISQGSGAPPAAYSSGNNPVAGDTYFRTDTPTVANQRIYICTVGGGAPTWVGIV